VPGWSDRKCFSKVDRVQGSEEGQEEYFGEMARCSPATVDPLRDYDQSFVFFGEKPNGPTGNEEMPLTPDVSVASDPNIYPGGSLLLISGHSFVDSKKCDSKAETTLSITQNINNYINACHLDRYAGAGKAAKDKASAYKYYGPVYIAVMKGGTPDETVVCR
jgi:membrane-bound lytic murein transglycosylase